MLRAPHVLAGVAAAQAKKFLVELANLREEAAAGNRFLLHFVRLCPLPGKYSQPLMSQNIDRTQGAKSGDEQIDEMLREHWLSPLREGVGGIWTAPDLRTKQWGVLRMLDETSFKEDQTGIYLWPFWTNPRKVISLPPPTAFELALRYLIRSNVHTYLCANRECPAPYFIASRRGQKYCSYACALSSRREVKQRWWAAHGNAWRKARKRKRICRKRKL
jgi:hypothetical protein